MHKCNTVSNRWISGFYLANMRPSKSRCQVPTSPTSGWLPAICNLLLHYRYHPNWIGRDWTIFIKILLWTVLFVIGFCKTLSTFWKGFYLEATDVTTTFLMMPHHPRYFYLLCPDKCINSWGDLPCRLPIGFSCRHDENGILVSVCIPSVVFCPS